MTFENSLTSHLEALRSPNPPSTASENAKGYTTPSRYSGSFMASHSQPSNEAVRVGLQRRFTTDLIKMPKLTPIGQPPATKAEPIEPSATVRNKNLTSSSIFDSGERTVVASETNHIIQRKAAKAVFQILSLFTLQHNGHDLMTHLSDHLLSIELSSSPVQACMIQPLFLESHLLIVHILSTDPY